MSILIALAVLALVSSIASGSTARAQTATNSTSSVTSTPSTSAILFYSSISESNVTLGSESSHPSTWATSSFEMTTSSTALTSNTSAATGTTTAAPPPPNLTPTSTTTRSVTNSASTYSDPVTVTVTSTTTSQVALASTTSVIDGAGYSISFSPQYWFCNGVSVTFTGPLVESGLYGDTLQFEYFQYDPTYPSVLIPIFTDSGLTVTSDTVNYWINPIEYSQLNFAYQPNLAVKVLDLTPQSNGYVPGLLYMQLTNIMPQGAQYCQLDSPPIPAPEFPTTLPELLLIIISIGLSLAFVRVHKHPQRNLPTR